MLKAYVCILCTRVGSNSTVTFPNIMPIYDAGEEDGSYYVVTEHIQGARTLAAYCRPDNLLRVDDVVEIIYKCAKALHYAHGRGVIHRDIKPSNVPVTRTGGEPTPEVTDFGIAKATQRSLEDETALMQTGQFIGTPQYMSPNRPTCRLWTLGRAAMSIRWESSCMSC